MGDAKKLGLHLALALRAHDERQVFTESGGLGGGAPFCLANAPVLFHLQNDRELLEYIQGYSGDLSKLDYRKVYDKVADSEDNEATAAMRRIATSLSSPARTVKPPMKNLCPL